MALVDLPDDLHARLLAMAEAECRTVELQIAYMVKRYEAQAEQNRARQRRHKANVSERDLTLANVSNVTSGTVPQGSLLSPTPPINPPNPSGGAPVHAGAQEVPPAGPVDHPGDEETALAVLEEEALPVKNARRGRGVRPAPKPGFEYPEWFKAFWARAPFEDKMATYKAAMAHNPDEALIAEFNKGLDAWLASERWADGIVCNGQTWFNQFRWEDRPHAKGAPVSLSVVPDRTNPHADKPWWPIWQEAGCKEDAAGLANFAATVATGKVDPWEAARRFAVDGFEAAVTWVIEQRDAV